MEKKHNERNAGRKPKFTCESVLKRIPIDLIGQIDKLIQPYLRLKKNGSN